MVDSCEKSHHLVFIPMPKEWLFRLIQFIYTKEEKLLPEGLVKLLTHYARAKEYTTTDLPNLQETD